MKYKPEKSKEYKQFWRMIISKVCEFPITKKGYAYFAVAESLKVSPFELYIDYLHNTLLFRVDNDIGRDTFINQLSKYEIPYEIVGENKIFRIQRENITKEWN